MTANFSIQLGKIDNDDEFMKIEQVIPVTFCNIILHNSNNECFRR